MNLFYEEYPMTILVGGEDIPIITDFREHIKLLDMLKDDTLDTYTKVGYVSQYFKEKPGDFLKAFDGLMDFVSMEELNTDARSAAEQEQEVKKDVYSFSIDFPFIFAAFLRDYGINLKTIKYMHWWEFRLLFEGLSEDTEIKQRIMYRSINLSEIKDKEERKRIEKIQRAIRLPDTSLSDYEIADAFGW